MTHTTATGGARPFRSGVVVPLTTDLPTWRDRVRRIADSGYSTLLMPDVPQWQPAPGPTLALAASLADLRVGTWVYASPLRPAWSTAWEAHSLSVLTDGRFEMGVGTGRELTAQHIDDVILQAGSNRNRPWATHSAEAGPDTPTTPVSSKNLDGLTHHQTSATSPRPCFDGAY